MGFSDLKISSRFPAAPLCDALPFGATKPKSGIDFAQLQDPRSSERLHLRCRDPAALINGKESGLICSELERPLKAKGYR